MLKIEIEFLFMVLQMFEFNGEIGIGGQFSKVKLELFFEYLMVKDILKWIIIIIDQVGDIKV